ncbi:hypothetical protein D1007_13689 [Hordeum vulgare]|nr:hypothetical protein D1007_13689 [Hordeum vulgare]
MKPRQHEAALSLFILHCHLTSSYACLLYSYVYIFHFDLAATCNVINEERIAFLLVLFSMLLWCHVHLVTITFDGLHIVYVQFEIHCRTPDPMSLLLHNSLIILLPFLICKLLICEVHKFMRCGLPLVAPTRWWFRFNVNWPVLFSFELPTAEWEDDTPVHIEAGSSNMMHCGIQRPILL